MGKVYFAIFLTCISASALAAGSTPAVKKPVESAKAHEEAQQEVAYADLGKYVGKRIVVHTRLGTVRAGTLSKFSNSALILKLDGGADLDVPAETVKRITVPVAPPDPLFPDKK